MLKQEKYNNNITIMSIFKIYCALVLINVPLIYFYLKSWPKSKEYPEFVPLFASILFAPFLLGIWMPAIDWLKLQFFKLLRLLLIWRVKRIVKRVAMDSIFSIPQIKTRKKVSITRLIAYVLACIPLNITTYYLKLPWLLDLPLLFACSTIICLLIKPFTIEFYTDPTEDDKLNTNVKS